MQTSLYSSFSNDNNIMNQDDDLVNDIMNIVQNEDSKNEDSLSKEYNVVDEVR